MDIKGFRDTINWYDQNSEQYSASANNLDFVQEITSFCERLHKPAKVLDAGCGNGRDSAVFNKLGTNVVGVDISTGLLSEARKNNPDMAFIKGDLLHLPFPDGEFDGVWSLASLVHLETSEDVSQALTEFHRVLKPNGYLFVQVKEQSGSDETTVVTDSVIKHDRFFRYYKQSVLGQMIEDMKFALVSNDIEPDKNGRPEVKWIKIIAQKL